MDMNPEKFEELVVDAIDALPEDLAALMDNVVVVVDHDTGPGELMGLYEGIPLTQRDDYGGFAAPDCITIFRRSICQGCDTDDQVREEVRTTVVHEIAHHFGIDDDRLQEMGWA